MATINGNQLTGRQHTLRPLPTPCLRARCNTQIPHAPAFHKTHPLPSKSRLQALPPSSVQLPNCPSQAPPITRRTATLHHLLTATAIALQPLLQTLPASAKQAPGDWSAPGLNTPVDDAAPKFFKTPTGVKVQELSLGTGPAVQKGDTVLFDYVLRRSNGYFIYGTLEGVSFQPKDVPVGPVSFRLGDGQVIPGLEEVLTGMQPGGRRRALIPPAVGYTDAGYEPQPPTFSTKRQLDNHRKEPLLFEVQVLRVGGKK